MPFIKFCFPFALLLVTHFCSAQGNGFPLVTPGTKVSIVYDSKSVRLDSIVANLLAGDIERVTSFRPRVMTDIAQAKGTVIVIGNIQSALVQKLIGIQSPVYKNLLNKWECFAFRTVDKPTVNISKALVIAGSDARGMAYGVFTLSQKIGVSPWYWWADVPTRKVPALIIHQPDSVSAPPAVKYRGIFINDEDWGLQPWAAKTFEPETGDIGPKTYAKVFELLLRLKANLIWPAMHPSTKAFFYYPGNVTTAEDYQIIIGSSHAEPMLRNNVGEWDVNTMGHFNYITNKDKIYRYWEDRVKQAKGINAIYTMGMRGIHDGQMEGVKNLDEAVPLLEQIIQEQRDLLSMHINSNVTAIPQVFTAYKEVLDIYDKGLKIPDDITLIWPDDNYGYIQRLSNDKERNRTGGSGVYYHTSYWGRPHDYLWLSSTHPSLIREEMMKAYEMGADRLWVVNVGDIKPLEYNIQFFLDMAYAPLPFKEGSYTKKHLTNWVKSLFGSKNASQIQNILWEYYNLAFERRPEFMGWSQTEPTTRTNYTQYNHFFFGDEAQRRIDRYNELELAVKKLMTSIDPKTTDAFYQLVYYPVTCASWINKKFLYRDKAFWYGKQNRLSAYDYARLSRMAYDNIVKETGYYNNKLAGGKWKNIMSMKPRDLPVYQEPVMPQIHIDSTYNWGIAPEGFVNHDSSLLKNNTSLVLPPFDRMNKQRYFVDIFLSKNQSLEWTASLSDNWIVLSKTRGKLDPGEGKNQARLWVELDWNKVPLNQDSARVIFSAGKNRFLLNIQINNYNRASSRFKGFIENNSYLAIHATQYNRRKAGLATQWKIIEGLGHTGNALQVLPFNVISKASADSGNINVNNSCVEYDFLILNAGMRTVTLQALPTQPVNNNYSVRCAVSIDDGPLKIIDFRTYGRSDEWKQNVLSNKAIRSIEIGNLDPGMHNLKIYSIDPGVILDEIMINKKGLKNGYSVMQQTRRNNVDAAYK